MTIVFYYGHYFFQVTHTWPKTNWLMGAFNGILYIGYTWTCSLLDLCLDPWKKMTRNQFFLQNRDSLSCDSCQLFPAFHKVMEQSETRLSCKWVQGDWYLSVQSICHSRWNLSSFTTVCWSSSYISFPVECDMAGECTSALPHSTPSVAASTAYSETGRVFHRKVE